MTKAEVKRLASKLYEALYQYREELYEKREKIEDHAIEMDRAMTAREEERYDEMGDQIDELDEYLDSVSDLVEWFEEQEDTQ